MVDWCNPRTGGRGAGADDDGQLGLRPDWHTHGSIGGTDSGVSDVNVLYPYQFDGRGRTAAADDPRHVRDLIEQVLFTSPGERVMRPEFGSGVQQLLFEPNSETVAAVVQMTVQAALNQWLGELVLVDEVMAESNDAALTLTVRYTRKLTGEARTEVFER